MEGERQRREDDEDRRARPAQMHQEDRKDRNPGQPRIYQEEDLRIQGRRGHERMPGETDAHYDEFLQRVATEEARYEEHRRRGEEEDRLHREQQERYHREPQGRQHADGDRDGARRDRPMNREEFRDHR